MPFIFVGMAAKYVDEDTREYHNPEALPSWDTKRRNDEEQIRTKQIQNMKTLTYKKKKNCNRGTASERSVGNYSGLNQFYMLETSPLILMQLQMTNTVEFQWLEYLWDRGKLFEIWVFRATEG